MLRLTAGLFGLALLQSCVMAPKDDTSAVIDAFVQSHNQRLENDPAYKNAEQRRKTCDPAHLKPGMGWDEVKKFCPGAPDRRVVSSATLGESVMLVYEQAPTQTYVYSSNGIVTSVRLLQGY
jgi:hypothetical protein